MTSSYTDELRAINARLKRLEDRRETDREDFLRHLADAKESTTQLTTALKEIYGNGRPGLIHHFEEAMERLAILEEQETARRSADEAERARDIAVRAAVISPIVSAILLILISLLF